ncbi:MAG: pyridoxal-dependent decarboxylase [Pseudomonadota bacterium]
MDIESYRKWARRAVDWTATYQSDLGARPVRPNAAPGVIAAALPDSPPEDPEPMETIFADFERIVPDGLTHWQHPRFFAYFPSNAHRASMVAEHLVAGVAVNAMLWQTSPAATEIEGKMIAWLASALGLPGHWSGLIQDAASTATLCAVLTMRERALSWAGIAQGVAGGPTPRIYASAQNHSSIDKACWISGIGQDNLVKIPTDASHAMDPAALRAAIAADRAAGFVPAGVVIVVGGTAVGASDQVAEIATIAREEGLYTHLDAAWAGSAMICPEFRPLWEGVEMCDSVVFNPHKWLGANFDCSVQFLADPVDQVKTLGLRPDYLQTLGQSEIVNYSEWTVPLGRRFRALKLWFLLRAEGLSGLRRIIRNHVAWTLDAHDRIARIPGIEITTAPALALFSFAMTAGDAATRDLIERINAGGRIYLTQTTHEGRFVIRFTVGTIDCTERDVMEAVEVIAEAANPGRTGP